MTLKIGFHSNQLSLRGTEIALFDYASYNQTLLNNNSVIFHDAHSPHNDAHVLEKFKGRFDVIAYQDRAELDNLLQHHAIDLLYAIKSGKKDGLLAQTVPTMVHAVFPTSPSQVHGANYAFISEWLSAQCSNKHIPCVPHIVALPNERGDLRSRHGIPQDALVLGCHGGRDNFDVTCAIQAVRQLLSQH